MSKYNKNSIITGPLDSYCLICESYLRDQNEINLHIAKPIHVKNLETVPYFEKHKNERIRKVKIGYYCEFCNRLFSTAAKVGIHVVESQHIQNKGSQLLERTFGGVLAFGKIFINDKAWNGIIEGTCTLCNIEFDSESIHMTSQSHVLNMIKINVEFANNSVYRKIDEESFHCLTCNEVIALQKLSDHFVNSDHKKKILIYHINSKLIDSSKINELFTNANTSSYAVSDSKAATKMSSITPKQKSAMNPKEYDAVLLKSMKAFDYMKTHGNEGFRYCMLCEWLLDHHEISRHVESQHHLTMLKMHKDRLEQMSKVEENSSKDLSNSEDDSNMNKWLEAIADFQNNDIKDLSNSEVKSCEDDSNMNKGLESIADFQKNNIKDLSNSEVKSCEDDSNMNKGLESIADFQKNDIKDLSNSEVKSCEDDSNMNKGLESIADFQKNDIKDIANIEVKSCEDDSNINKGLESTADFQKNDIKDISKSEVKSCEDDPNMNKGLESIADFQKNNIKDLSNSEVKSCEDDSNMNKVLESIADFQKNEINIDLVSSTAICKKCSMHLGIDYNGIKTHIKEHKAKSNKKDMIQNLFTYSQKGTEGLKTTLFSKPVFLKRNDLVEAHTSTSSVSSKSEEDLKAFATQNYMSINHRKVFCNICQTHLPISIKNLKQHVNGVNHKFRMPAKGKVKSGGFKRVSINAFVQNIVGVENLLFQDAVINDKLCVNGLSFMFIRALDNSMWECHSCDVTCGVEEIENHKMSDTHSKTLLYAPCVMMDSEFIREARPNYYHCGFCNILEYGWSNMESHLSSVEHKENKSAAEWRLRQYAPQLRERVIKKKLHAMAFIHMTSASRFKSHGDSSSDSD